MFCARIVKELAKYDRFTKKYMGTHGLLNVRGVLHTYDHFSRLFLFAVKKSLKFAKCQLSTRGPIVNGEVVLSPSLYEAQTYEKNFSFHLEAFHKSLINAYLDYHAWAAKLALICQAAHSLCLTVGPNDKNLPIIGFKIREFN